MSEKIKIKQCECVQCDNITLYTLKGPPGKVVKCDTLSDIYLVTFFSLKNKGEKHLFSSAQNRKEEKEVMVGFINCLFIIIKINDVY